MLHQPRHTIGDGEVHVWHLLTDDVADVAQMGGMHDLLSADEKARLGRVAHQRDRVLYAWSRALMRTVLASYLDCKCHDVRFSANAFGKPVLCAENAPPPIQFNLTHSRGAIALAVSRKREVGIDIEERHRPIEYLALAERYFAPTEARHLQQQRPEQCRDAFFAIWTLKEAYVKAIGRGISFPLDAFCFDLDVDRLIAFRPLADFVSWDWHFHQFTLGERHCGAVAVQNPPGHAVRIEMREWRSEFARDL